MFLFLHRIRQFTEDEEIHFKFLQACAKCKRYKEMEDVIKANEFYDPIRVKEFLINDAQLVEMKPLIILCDLHGYIEELITYLYNNNRQDLIHIYIFKVSPNQTPKVLGTLIDLESDEKYLKQLLFNISSGLSNQCNAEDIVEEFEKRNKMRVLQGWLEARLKEGNQLPAIHNAVAKLYIDMHKDP